MKCKLLLLIIVLPVLLIRAQDDINKYEEMQNAFILGLEEKGLGIGHQLISLPEFEGVRPDALFYLSEFFLDKALSADDGNEDIEKINIAYTLLKMYDADYPNGNKLEMVKRKISIIENEYRDFVLFGNLLDEYRSERRIVHNKIVFANKLLTFLIPNPFAFFGKTEQNQSGVDMTNKYFDDVIINHPRFKVFGYYYKIISLFGNFWGNDIVKDGWFEVKNQVIRNSDKGRENKAEIKRLVNEMSTQFPSHPLTLEIHLICAKEFMHKDWKNIDNETLNHLRYILDNDEDKLSNRYLLVKEFILNNTFGARK